MTSSSDSSADSPESLDLEQLKDLDFGPKWSSGGEKAKTAAPGERKERRPTGPAPDRRPARKTASRPKREAPPQRVDEFEPVVAFSIFPEDEPFDLLTQSIRSSLKIYELFEITRLILDKHDRMVVVVAPLSEEAAPLYESLRDRQLYLDRETALRRAAEKALPAYFEEVEEEVEPPSGNFSSVMRCRLTDTYLPPRNYHRFQTMLREHQRRNCPGKTVEQVEKSLESVADPGAVEQWLASMRKRTVFRLRETPVETGAPAGSGTPDPGVGTEAPAPEPTGDPPGPETASGGTESGGERPEAPVFDSREAAIQRLLLQEKDALVRETRQARVPAKALAEAEDPAIRKSFLSYLERQKRFPLESANNVRMKLRKAKFFLFKKGKKGISYVAPVRRKNRPPDAVFADSVGKIIAVLEQNPGLRLKDLPGRLHPERVEESGKANLGPDETRQLVQDLKWLKSEGYLYEFADGTLEIQPVGESAREPAPPETAEPAVAGEPPPDGDERAKRSGAKGEQPDA